MKQRLKYYSGFRRIGTQLSADLQFFNDDFQREYEAKLDIDQENRPRYNPFQNRFILSYN